MREVAWLVAVKIKLKLNSKGFNELLTGAEVQELVEHHAEIIANRCGEGYETRSFRGGFGGGRRVATVRPVTYEALKDEAENKTLEKAVHR